MEYMVRYAFWSRDLQCSPQSTETPHEFCVRRGGPLGLLDLERTARRVYKFVVGHVT